VGHWATATRAYPDWNRGTARSRGEYPTAETCVETQGDAGAQALEAIGFPILIAGDVILAIPRIADERERLSPLEGEGYARDARATP